MHNGLLFSAVEMEELGHYAQEANIPFGKSTSTSTSTTSTSTYSLTHVHSLTSERS